MNDTIQSDKSLLFLDLMHIINKRMQYDEKMYQIKRQMNKFLKLVRLQPDSLCDVHRINVLQTMIEPFEFQCVIDIIEMCESYKHTILTKEKN